MSVHNSITIKVLEIANNLIAEKKVKSFSQFASIIGSTPQSVTEVKKGRRNFTVEQISAFIAEFQLDARDIFGYSDNSTAIKGIHTIAVDYAGSEKVVLVDRKAAAGYLDGFEDPEFMATLPVMATPPQLNHKSLYGFEVVGDSMEPNLYNAEWALCSVVEKLDWIHLNFVYVLVCEEGIVIKRITEINKDAGYLTLTSDNIFYPPYQVPLKEVKKIFCLEASFRTKFPPRQKNMEARLKSLEEKMQ